MTILIEPGSLVLTPAPGPVPNVTRDRVRARALRAWQRGELELAVTYRGRPVTPEQVRWDAVDTGSGSSGAPSSHAQTSVRWPPDDLAALDALRAVWRLERPEAIRRAVREALAREKRTEPPPRSR